MIPCCCNTRCLTYKGLYMKYMLGQFWVAHKYRDNKFVKMWLDETRFQRDAASAVRTKAFYTLLKNAKDDEAAALKVLQAGGYVRRVAVVVMVAVAVAVGMRTRRLH